MKKCGKCGMENTDDSIFCAGCGATLDQPAPAADPAPSAYSAPAYSAPAYSDPAAPVAKNTATLWLILNIVLTVLCCGNIAGIIGIIFAAIGMGSFNKGNYADMNQKTKVAKILFFVGLGLGILSLIIGLAAGLIPAIIAAANNGY